MSDFLGDTTVERGYITVGPPTFARPPAPPEPGGSVWAYNRATMKTAASLPPGIALALLTIPCLLHAQASPPVPRYQISTHLVQFGVIARNKDGLVPNLTKEDFVVLDRKKPQSISVFQAESPAPVVQPPDSLPPNTFSNESRYNAVSASPVTIILLDNLNTEFGSDPQPYEDTPLWLEDHALGMAKERLLSFLRHMDLRDRVAIYGLTEQLHVLCDFTCNREQLLAVVGAYDARSITARESANPQDFHLPNSPKEFNDAIDRDTRELAAMKNTHRAELTMAALAAIAGHVADLPGRKNLLWLTADVPASGQAIAAVLARGNLVAYPVDARGLLPVSSINIAPNPIDVMPSHGPAPMPPGQTAMADMAADTGGHAFLNINNLTDAIQQVVEDSAATYTLGFYLPQAEVDGQFHRIAVQVKKPGITLTYPRGYFAFRDAAANDNDRHDMFVAALRSPLYSAAVQVDVRLARVQQTPHTLQVMGVTGIEGVAFQQQGDIRTGALDVYAVQQDPAGNVLQQNNQRINLRLNEQQYRAYLHSGVLFRQIVSLHPETTMLRVLVQDVGTAGVGCVIIPLDQLK